MFAAAPDGSVAVFPHGRDGRPMPRRSAAMEAMVVEAVEAVLAAAHSGAEGLLHMMRRLGERGRVVPLHVGRAGRHGRSGAAASADIVAIRAEAGRFARRGHNHAHHLGDVGGAAADRRREIPVRRPGSAVEGIWRGFAACPLAPAECLPIGVAGLMFPDDPLNDEGVNRAAAIAETGPSSGDEPPSARRPVLASGTRVPRPHGLRIGAGNAPDGSWLWLRMPRPTHAMRS